MGSGQARDRRIFYVVSGKRETWLAASLLDIDFKSSILAVMGGVLLAGVIMGLASVGVLGALNSVIF